MSASGQTGILLPPGAQLVYGYPGNQANAVATASLPAVAGKTNFLCGYMVTTDSPTAAVIGILSVSGIAIPFAETYPAQAAPAATPPLKTTLPIPLPATGPNTAINVSLSALGAGSANARVVAFGYVL